MKKDRNSFFSEYGMNAYNMQQPMMPNMAPQQVQSNSSFYAGPAPMMQGQMGMGDNYTNDLDSRLSKIERQINRLESRISKLEGEFPTNFNKVNTETDYNYSNSSMYMV